MYSPQTMRITIAQLYVEQDITRNRAKILSVLNSAQSGDWVVFPEGALTGYFPERDDFLANLTSDAVDQIVQEIGREVQRAQCYCLLGSATFKEGSWYNSVFLQNPMGETHIYR